jgi:hypothetical protein
MRLALVIPPAVWSDEGESNRKLNDAWPAVLCQQARS